MERRCVCSEWLVDSAAAVDGVDASTGQSCLMISFFVFVDSHLHHEFYVKLLVGQPVLKVITHRVKCHGVSRNKEALTAIEFHGVVRA